MGAARPQETMRASYPVDRGGPCMLTKRADGPRVEKADKPRAQTCIPGSFPSRGTHGRWVFLYPGHLALAGLAGALKDRP